MRGFRGRHELSIDQYIVSLRRPVLQRERGGFIQSFCPDVRAQAAAPVPGSGLLFARGLVARSTSVPHSRCTGTCADVDIDL
jgi:hypothetical protein